MVKENIVADVGAGIVIEGKGPAERVAVDNNEVFDVATAREDAAFRSASSLTSATSAAVVGNTVARVGLGAPDARLRAGIARARVDDVHVSGNVVEEIGPPDGFLGVRRRHRRRSARSTPPRSRTTRRASAPGGPAPTRGRLVRAR